MSLAWVGNANIRGFRVGVEWGARRLSSLGKIMVDQLGRDADGPGGFCIVACSNLHCDNHASARFMRTLRSSLTAEQRNFWEVIEKESLAEQLLDAPNLGTIGLMAPVLQAEPGQHCIIATCPTAREAGVLQHNVEHFIGSSMHVRAAECACPGIPASRLYISTLSTSTTHT